MDELVISKLVQVFALPLFSHICFGQIGISIVLVYLGGVEGIGLGI